MNDAYDTDSIREEVYKVIPPLLPNGITLGQPRNIPKDVKYIYV
jgi:hypothetical protein